MKQQREYLNDFCFLCILRPVFCVLYSVSCVLCLVSCLLFCGCSIAYEQTQDSGPGFLRRFVSMRNVHNGMMRSEVKELIGAPVVIGQELPDSRENRYKPVTIENPYRSKTVKKGTSEYQVDFYFMGIVKADGEVGDEELLPLVFQNEKLIGQGWEYLERIKE